MDVDSAFTAWHDHIDRDRLVDTAQRLIAVPSPTGQAGAALDCLADILQGDGFLVDRHEAGHAAAPAVIARLSGSRPGGSCSSTDISTRSTSPSCRRASPTARSPAVARLT